VVKIFAAQTSVATSDEAVSEIVARAAGMAQDPTLAISEEPASFAVEAAYGRSKWLNTDPNVRLRWASCGVRSIRRNCG